jgi:hypothetical protein
VDFVMAVQQGGVRAAAADEQHPLARDMLVPCQAIFLGDASPSCGEED